MRLTLDNIGSSDPYMYTDEEGYITRIKCDVTNMHIKSHNKPGLARYAVIDERRNNVKWVKKGECTWGIGGARLFGNKVRRGDIAPILILDPTAS